MHLIDFILIHHINAYFNDIKRTYYKTICELRNY